MELTDRQTEVLDFITSYIEGFGFAPTLRELASGLKIKSHKNVISHIDALEKKGYIERTSAKSRAIRIVGAGNSASGDNNADIMTVPLLGSVKAGLPTLAVENSPEMVSLDKNIFGNIDNLGELFLLTVEGESMIDAGIDSGDLVLVQKGREIMAGRIGVFIIDGESTVKRLVQKNGKIFLKPENQSMGLIEVDEASDFYTVGPVMSVIKRRIR